MPSHYLDDYNDPLIGSVSPSVAATPGYGPDIHPIFGRATTDSELSEFDVMHRDANFVEVDGKLVPKEALKEHTNYLAKKYKIPMEGKGPQEIIATARNIAGLSNEFGRPFSIGDELPGNPPTPLRTYAHDYQDIGAFSTPDTDVLSDPTRMGLGGGYSYRGEDPYADDPLRAARAVGGGVAAGAARLASGTAIKPDELRSILQGYEGDVLYGMNPNQSPSLGPSAKDVRRDVTNIDKEVNTRQKRLTTAMEELRYFQNTLEFNKGVQQDTFQKALVEDNIRYWNEQIEMLTTLGAAPSPSTARTSEPKLDRVRNIPTAEETAIIANPFSADILTAGFGIAAKAGTSLISALTKVLGRQLTKMEAKAAKKLTDKMDKEFADLMRKGTPRPAQRYLDKKGNVIEIPEGIYE